MKGKNCNCVRLRGIPGPTSRKLNSVITYTLNTNVANSFSALDDDGSYYGTLAPYRSNGLLYNFNNSGSPQPPVVRLDVYWVAPTAGILKNLYFIVHDDGGSTSNDTLNMNVWVATPASNYIFAQPANTLSATVNIHNVNPVGTDNTNQVIVNAGDLVAMQVVVTVIDGQEILPSGVLTASMQFISS